MTEEDLRLLQAAVSSIVDDEPAPSTVIIDADPALENLPEEDIEKLLAQLQDGLSQPEPVQQDPQQPVFAEHGKENADLKFDQALVQQITEALAQGDNVPGDIPSTLLCDNPATAQFNEEDHNETLAALQRAFETYSRTLPRAGSVHSSESSPSPSAQVYSPVPLQPPNHDASAAGLLQCQELASMMITGEILRQSNNRAGSSISGYPVGSGGRRNSTEDSQAYADDPSKAAERERIREENRERKKRWREVNQDRNKDNDLRCRVTKRATRLFGSQPSLEKTEWINEEFNKRKQKRELKEKAKGDVPGSSSTFSASDYHPQLRTLNDLMPKGESEAGFTMDGLVEMILKGPLGLITELHKVATEVSGHNVPLQQPPPPQPPHHLLRQPTNASPQYDQFSNTTSPTTPPQDPGSVDLTTIEGLVQGLTTGSDIPEGFDLLLAELAGNSTGETEVSAEAAIATPDELDGTIDEKSVDELLAALTAADPDSGLVLEKTVDNSNEDKDTLEELNALFVSELDENSGFEMTEETLERIITEYGISPSEDDAAAHNEAEKSPDLEIPPEELEGMSIDEIDQLLEVLNPGNPTASSLNTSVVQHPIPPRAQPVPPPYAAAGDPDTSATYTPENVAAILRAIFEGIKLPTPPPPLLAPPASRSTKRPLPPTFHATPPPPKRVHREQSPHISAPSAVDHLRGVVEQGVNQLRPDANSDAINKRLLALKPPPYIPRVGAGVGSASVPTPLPTKKKSPEDEKKIKAMGFPPLMAGIKRKEE